MFVYAYQIKIAISLKRLELSSFQYFTQYFKDNNNSGFSHIEKEIPWITYSSIKKLDKILNKNMKVFEYGSGGSTLFYAKRVSEVISVEHDESWFLHLKSVINEKKIENVKLNLKIPVSYETLLNGQTPYKSVHKKEYSEFVFNEYVNFIDSFEDNYFDMIVIDGRARPYCLKHSLSKLKPGGYILYDNFERKIYHDDDFKKIQNWKIHSCFQPVAGCRHFSDTGIFQKPI